MIRTFQVAGMSCAGCARSVQAAITNALPGTKVAVELNSGRVTVHGGGDLHTIRKAVEEAGFQFVDEVADPGDARAD